MNQWHRRLAVAGLGAWNVVVNKHLAPRLYVPANVTASAATYLLGRAAGLKRRDLGLTVATLSRGLRWGAAGAAVVAAGAACAARHPLTGPLFDDARADPATTRFETLVRIPLGTVLLEEIGFRGVLPALLDGPARRHASARSAVLFGLWHVIPTLNTLDINAIRDRRVRTRAVAAGVATTTAAGWLFDELRLRSGSLVAPALLHWSANAVSYALAARRRADANEPPG